MKLLFIVPIYLEGINEVKKLQFLGGGGRYPLELAKNIASLKKDQVEMVFFGKNEESMLFEGMKITLLSAVNFFTRFNSTANPLPISLKFFQKIKQADVIHCIQIRTEATLLATIFAKLIKKPIFLTDNNFSGLSVSRIIRLECLANAVLTISREDYDSWKVKNREVIYGGVDIKRFSYQRAKKRYVLYAGRIASHKGVDVLVRAMPDNYKLIIAGVPLEKDFMIYLREIAKEKNVDFIENPSDEELINLYREASCFVLPATVKDYLGKVWGRPGLYALVVLEAMSCGTPVIVSDVGSLPNFIEDDRNGFVFHDRDISDLREKIMKIMGNKNLALQMSRKCRELVKEKYSWKTIAKNVRRIYFSKM